MAIIPPDTTLAEDMDIEIIVLDYSNQHEDLFYVRDDYTIRDAIASARRKV
jgi:hypothetical protein